MLRRNPGRTARRPAAASGPRNWGWKDFRTEIRQGTFIGQTTGGGLPGRGGRVFNESMSAAQPPRRDRVPSFWNTFLMWNYYFLGLRRSRVARRPVIDPERYLAIRALRRDGTLQRSAASPPSEPRGDCGEARPLPPMGPTRQPGSNAVRRFLSRGRQSIAPMPCLLFSPRARRGRQPVPDPQVLRTP